MKNQVQYPALHVMVNALSGCKEEHPWAQAHHIASHLDAKGYLILKSSFFRARCRRSLYLGFGLGGTVAYPLVLLLQHLLA